MIILPRRQTVVRDKAALGFASLNDGYSGVNISIFIVCAFFFGHINFVLL